MEFVGEWAVVQQRLAACRDLVARRLAVLEALAVAPGKQVLEAGCAAGYRALVAWVGTLGMLRRAGVEGTGSYGAALARHLRAAGVEVIEVNAPDKPTRRRRGKTDTLDAQAAARAVLSGRASGSAKTGDGPVEMLRMLKMAKDSAVKARSQTINQLRAVLVRPIQPCVRRCRA
jgi:transposase